MLYSIWKYLAAAGVAAAFFTSHAAFAEVTVTAESAVTLALPRNPELIAARLTIAEAEARVAGAGRLDNPEFEAELAAGKERQNSIELALTQRFPVTARLRLEKEVSRLEVEKAKAEVALREWQIGSEARIAVIQHIAAREALELAQTQVETATKLANFTTARVQEGQASSLEAGIAALEKRRLEASVATNTVELGKAAAELASLIGVTEPGEIRSQGNMAIPAALRGHDHIVPPTVSVAVASVEVGKREIALAEARRWQDVGVGVFIQRERSVDEPEGIGTEPFGGIRFSIPLPLWNDGKAVVQEKVAASERLEAELAAAQIKAENVAHAAHEEMKLRHGIALELNGELLSLARKQVEEHEAAYAKGEIGFDEVYRARERLTALEITALEARKEYHLSRARWMAGMARH